MSSKSRQIYEFGPFRLDPGEKLLLRDGEPVKLSGKPFEVLVALVEKSGCLVGKDELIKGVWGDGFVEEANLTNSVSTLRTALGDKGKSRCYVETVSGHGYRFAAGVKSLEVLSPPAAPAEAAACAAGEVLRVERHSVTSTTTEEEVLPDVEEEPGAEARVLTRGSRPWRRRAGWGLPVALSLLCLSAVAALTMLPRTAAPGETRRADTGAVAAAKPRTIAVLPFKIIGEGGGDEGYLGLGMADALITRLGRSRRLVVRPTSAVRRYTDAGLSAVAAGGEQGVDAVLEGSVQRSGGHVRVTVQLVNVASGVPIWAEKFDEEFTNIFAVQDAISQRVMRGLVVELSAEEREQLDRRGPTSAEAHQAYMKGRYFWNKRTQEGLKKSVDYFKQAVEADPGYALAHAGLADAYLLLGGYAVESQAEAIPKAREAAKRALALDQTLAEPHATLGLIAENYDWDWAEAESEYRRAVELNPNYATARHWRGEFLAFMGRHDEAVAEIRRAQELDPLSLIISVDVAKVYYLGRRYDLAAEQAKKTLEMDPDFAYARSILGFCYSALGRHEEAIAEIRRIKNLEDDPINLAYAGYLYGKAGRRDEARAALARLAERSKRTYVPPNLTMLVYAGLGDRDAAFEWFEKVFEEHTVGVADLKVNPVFDGLRADPRYADLLRRARFTP
jgi:DNA-binding winged helix-turn-helix (wHTH) protein/TolB-like protein/Tfp pilus assembly protein PilF